MSIKQFIKYIARKNDTNIKQLGVKIGRGGSASFWRTVTNGNTRAEELKNIIEATGEPFIIFYKGEHIEIK